MSQQPLRITVYPNLKVTGTSGGSFDNLTLEQRRLQEQGNNPFKMFDLNFPQIKFGNNMLWIALGLLALVTAATVVRKK